MTETRIDYSLGEYQGAVNSALRKMRKDNLIERIWAKDYTIWKPKPDEIANRLGWLDAPANTLEKIKLIRSSIDPLTKGSISDIVLLGIGGSSLAAEVFSKIFGSKTGYPQLHILDTTDPSLIFQLTRKLKLKKNLFLVSSKSGSTLEINSLFKYFYNLVAQESGKKAGNRFIFITDEGSLLIKTAENISANHIFLNNPNIGGRYSALSLPGIVPAALIGINVEKLLKRVLSQIENLTNAGTSLGASLGMLALNDRDKLTFILPPRWKSFGDWLEQLIAESTGKEGKGILPVLDEQIGNKNIYGKDRVFVFFQNKGNEKLSRIQFLIKAGHPVIRIKINDQYDLGTQMFVWQMATAVATHFLGVNPFDQPDVEATKKHTRAVIADNKKRKTKEKPALTFAQGEIYGNISGDTPAKAFIKFLRQARTGDYICLQVYLSPSLEIDKAVKQLRKAISKKYAMPVTFGYGPRYLHSTGQLHKGDSGNGLFIQLTQGNQLDVDIPDDIGKKKSSLTFGKLKAAQSHGDFKALTDKGRKIIRVHFPSDPVTGLKTIAGLL